MLSAISTFANQSYGLPIQPNAKTVTATSRPTVKVNAGSLPAINVYIKSKP